MVLGLLQYQERGRSSWLATVRLLPSAVNQSHQEAPVKAKLTAAPATADDATTIQTDPLMRTR